MDEMVLASFLDELDKIAANVATTDVSGVKPAAIPSLTKTISPATKPQTKATNYATINTQAPLAAPGVASGSKSVPPPPVRT
jgi:hypothetical protein